jgi:hypothetical protein
MPAQKRRKRQRKSSSTSLTAPSATKASHLIPALKGAVCICATNHRPFAEFAVTLLSREHISISNYTQGISTNMIGIRPDK